MLVETLLAAFLPVASDGVRGLFNKFTGGAGAKPANVEEVVTLMDAETKRLEALSKIDNAEGVSQWVSNIRALQRPVISFCIITAYVGVVAFNAESEIVNSIGGYAQMVTFYLFGDRTYMYMKKGK
jgi:hypothetical protein